MFRVQETVIANALRWIREMAMMTGKATVWAVYTGLSAGSYRVCCCSLVAT